MINSIRFTNFKTLSNNTIEFGDLTLLTGANGAGKSTVAQAILLMALAVRDKSGIASLNGDYGLSMGEAADLIGESGDANIEFEVELSDGSAILTFTAEPSARYLQLLKIASTAPGLDELFATGGVQYLAAERDGPRESQELPPTSPESIEVGFRGQYTAAVLAARDLEQVQAALEHPDAGKLRFTKQVEAWLKSFVPGVQLQWFTAAEVGKAAIRFKFDDSRDEWMRPGNVGFGITYCLPIIVAALSATAGSLLIVDTPEAHLHPSAQSAMGKFLARIAAAGVQVIVETHSDHVINGVRLASLVGTHCPPIDRVVINHFSRIGPPKIRRIMITPKGDLSERPRDFFDQSEKDLAEIVHIRFRKS